MQPLDKRPFIRARFPKKVKLGKKRYKTRKKRMCDRCKRRFDPEKLRVKHRIKLRKIPKHRTDGMNLLEFERLYSDKRKRPVHDRRKNLLVLCEECFDKE